MLISIPSGTERNSPAFLARGFRPFFTLAALYAALFVPIWVAVATGLGRAPPWLTPPLWHAHEMVHGFIAAAAAGFLLTAVPVWTGVTPLTGLRMAMLAAVWLLGRFAMLGAYVLPAAIIAVCDLAFGAALLAVFAPPLLRADQRRNRGFIAILIALLAGNAAFHLDATGLWPGAGARAARISLGAVLLLVVLVGGRIIPAFTQNALRRMGSARSVRSRPWLDRASLAAAVSVGMAEALVPGSRVCGAAKLVCALALAVRLGGWQTPSTRSDPLLWSLHAGFACAPIGLALSCVQELGAPISALAGLHMLTIGSFGTLILSVMSRVSLGHTGRALQAPQPLPWAYGAVLAAAALRVAGALEPRLALPALLGSGLLFSAAFATFLIVYLPILKAPRVDGQEG